MRRSARTRLFNRLETIRNRIDQFGVSEPTIQREGINHIVVQLPGIKDPQRAIELIGRTARLDFKMVREDISPTSGTIPEDAELLKEKVLIPQPVPSRKFRSWFRKIDDHR